MGTTVNIGTPSNNTVTEAILQSNVVSEEKLKVSNSPVNGYFLQAQSGDSGGLRWAVVDLTSLSAASLTSGTIPDARFPATLPAASAANLTNVPAANITGAMPAIDGSALTGVSSPEVYGFNTNAAGNLIVTTTNGGVDNISGTDYDAFEDVIFAATGFTFSVNANGKLIATI